LIRSAENDELPVLPVVLPLPVALYDVGDALDIESCSDCRNCCRMPSAELALDELLLDELLKLLVLELLPVADEPAVDDEAPWPP
jgi:hypothetical protein